MVKPKHVVCPTCGSKNGLPLAHDRCGSCGAKIENLERVLARQTELESHYQQAGFNATWFGISLAVVGVLTVAIVAGLPVVLPVFDFEGYAGMTVAVPVWFFAGILVGMISPGRTFLEPVVAAFLVAMPTAFLLFQGQTIKVMPAFLYVLMAALGVHFTLIGTYLGERIQLGPARGKRS